MKPKLRKIINYLNPIKRLGKTHYSIMFPLIATSSAVIILDLIVNLIIRNPESVGIFAIFIFVALIIYFSFRDGIRGGFIASTITIAYYFYIIYALNYTGKELIRGIETTLILGVVYFITAGIIGWLKETIDKLIEREADARRRLEAVIEQLPVGIIIVNKSGKFISANKKIESIVGSKIPRNFVVGVTRFVNFIDGEKKVELSQYPLAKALKGKIVINKELVIDRNDHKLISVSVSSSPIKNKKGSIIAAASIISDITQQKELEKRKDDFVNMASHELKTPITSMNLYLSSLMNSLKDTKNLKAIKTLKNVQAQTKKIQELVEDLLDVSRLHTGKLTYRKEEFRIDQLVSETVNALQDSTSQKIIFGKHSPILVNADRFRIYQVLTNLLTNAIKYSSNSGDIIVGVRKNSETVTVSVKDHGIGIDRDQQNKVFDRLYQVTGDAEKTFPGLGLGLYISKSIITEHKGKIWFDSKKGEGSTFFFSLPAGSHGLPVSRN